MVLTILLITVSLQVPAWQRQPDEACADYLARVGANEHALWKREWCVGGRCDRRRAPKSMRRYWIERWHGCLYPNDQEDPLIFKDDFETGDASRWTSQK